MDEWVEAEGQTVDLAVQVAMEELGISAREDAQIEVLQEPKQGVLGLGRQMAHVKVSRKAKSGGRKRRRRHKKPASQKNQSPDGGDKRSGRRRGGGQQERKPKNKPNRSQQSGRGTDREESGVTTPEVTIDDQAVLAKEFLEGLLGAFGLEGEVTTTIDKEFLLVDVKGEQTEALVGPKGSILQAIHELTRTVIQRKTFRAPRMRLDIAGYNERRREALRIFAGQVAEKVLEGGGEVMLEPMNPADRKVLHDAVADIEGVRSFSEGEDPRRSVVISPLEE